GSGRGPVQRFVAAVELLEHHFVSTEGADDVEPGERLLDMAVDLAGVLPLSLEQLLGSGADDTGDEARQGQGDQGQQGELPRDEEHHHADADRKSTRLNSSHVSISYDVS